MLGFTAQCERRDLGAITMEKKYKLLSGGGTGDAYKFGANMTGFALRKDVVRNCLYF